MEQDEIREEIRARIDLVELIGQHVRLQRSGRRYKGLCPFHQEKTPSFTVDPERGLWHCFGCGEGGDVFTFVMRTEGLSFPEAAQRLADRVGVRWQTDPHADARRERRTLLERAVETARRRFIEHLFRNPAAEAARDYLRGRGFSRATLEAFGIGYALDSWDDLLTALSRAGLSPEIAQEAGLVKAGERGGHYDVFRDRIIFPIADVTGRTVAFGGRALKADEPAKYLNSPDTPLFHKRRTLYGLNQARQAIVEAKTALIVEGYTDALSLHQAGLTNVVAGLGTALTREQLQLLARYCDEIVLVYDADAAGQQAATRNLEVFEGCDALVSLVTLPEGTDPDDFVRQHGPEGFRRLIADRVSPVEYRLRLIFDQHSTGGAEGRARAAQEAVEVLLQIRDWTARDEYLARAADLWGARDPGRTAAMARVLKLEFRRRARGEPQAGRAESPGDTGYIAKALDGILEGAPAAYLRAEAQLLSLALDDDAVAQRVAQELDPEDMLCEQDAAILKAIEAHLAAGTLDAKVLVAELPEEEGVRRRCVELLVAETEAVDTQELVTETIGWLKTYRRSGGVLIKSRGDKGAAPCDGTPVEDFRELERRVWEALNRGELSHDDPLFLQYQRVAAQVRRGGHEGYWGADRWREAPNQGRPPRAPQEGPERPQVEDDHAEDMTADPFDLSDD